MSTQIIIILGTLLAFVLLGFMLSRSIRKYEANKSAQKKKKVKKRYMPQSRTPGRN